MPYRTEDETGDRIYTTFHARTFAEMPSMVFQACMATGTPSLSRYYQEAVCRRLADDMGYDLDQLLEHLPPTRKQDTLFNGHRRVGPANTEEDVR
jgi:hypothetical protein